MLRIISFACIVAYVFGDTNSNHYYNGPGYNDIGYGVQTYNMPYGFQNNYQGGFNGGVVGSYFPQYFDYSFNFGGSAAAGAAASDDFGGSAASSATASGLGSAAAGAAAATGAAASAATAVGSGMFGNPYYVPYASYPSSMYYPNPFVNRFRSGYGRFAGGLNLNSGYFGGVPRFHKRQRSVY
ncbi:nuclear pore complex protein Nup98-Nup96-like [Saccostrea echinata]|uniref:nuclear pore complex protein Nup98-Nup96-like n=1 Tax=Saccostrea echinata TaxID=191078 RepID=UPI002A835A7F|nr:nuclear pore complex protein Nup98-Nup96-like [Saccostrea echinata]